MRSAEKEKKRQMQMQTF